MRIAVSGASGYVGSALLPVLTASGHRVIRMARGPVSPEPDVVSWDPAADMIESAALEGVDAVVHLAGESLFGLRWTRGRKRRITDSRVKGTALLARALAGLDPPPRALIAMSAVGYYGDRPGEVLREDSPPGAGFLAEVAQAWEQATAPASAAGIRVVNLRMGPVVGSGSPLLRTLEPIFKLGLGGWFGSGRQHWAWVDIDDVNGVIVQSIQRDDAVGTAEPRGARGAHESRVFQDAWKGAAAARSGAGPVTARAACGRRDRGRDVAARPADRARRAERARIQLRAADPRSRAAARPRSAVDPLDREGLADRMRPGR